MARHQTYDVIVVGAGVFGAWTAYFLRKSGASVLLLDAYGPANARASSGGESRIIRMGYGADEIYTRWSVNALPLWKRLFAEAGRPELFQQTGVLWIADENDQNAFDTVSTLQKTGTRFEKLSLSRLRERYPQIHFEDDCWGILEPESGVLMARRAVQTVVEQAAKISAHYENAFVRPPAGTERLQHLVTNAGETLSAATFVFACGSWLGKVFPETLGGRIFPSRQEVFFFGVPPGDRRFAPPEMPTWLKVRDEFYGMPDIEDRGFKIAHDRHGVRVDPDTQSRVASADAAAIAREYVARRFPALRDAPIVETRVCQYENTSNGDFLIDRHPHLENVWLVGGGSGHGFKHGPSLGEYLAARVTQGGPVEPRFSLATKQVVQKRAVF
ncbi:MAG TPA: FAD-dependent oxidoreductase [Candidatus Acidoferrum sp.]|nr:FAD-dependent oxidoreductase [Candidatus Acidoferrum sp.]